VESVSDPAKLQTGHCLRSTTAVIHFHTLARVSTRQTTARWHLGQRAQTHMTTKLATASPRRNGLRRPEPSKSPTPETMKAAAGSSYRQR
jgi:hypothetical protein